MLADTSAWVESDRATGSSVDRRLSELIRAAGGVAVTEPVVMEVLAGARDDRARDRPSPAADALRADGAVRIYRRCRAVGATPRGMVDCLIASVAWRREATLLAHDADMARVARVIGIAIDDASLHV